MKIIGQMGERLFGMGTAAVHDPSQQLLLKGTQQASKQSSLHI